MHCQNHHPLFEWETGTRTCFREEYRHTPKIQFIHMFFNQWSLETWTHLRISETIWKASPLGEKLVTQAERRGQSHGRRRWWCSATQRYNGEVGEEGRQVRQEGFLPRHPEPLLMEIEISGLIHAQPVVSIGCALLDFVFANFSDRPQEAHDSPVYKTLSYLPEKCVCAACSGKRY